MPKFRVGEEVLVDVPGNPYDLQVGLVRSIAPDRYYHGYKARYAYTVYFPSDGSVHDCQARQLRKVKDAGNPEVFVAIPYAGKEYGEKYTIPAGLMRIGRRGDYERSAGGNYMSYRRADDVEGLYREADSRTKLQLSGDLRLKVGELVSKEFPDLVPGSLEYNLLISSISGGSL